MSKAQQITQLFGEPQSRAIAFERAEINDETRTVEATLSSEALIDRGFIQEQLTHTSAAIDLSEAGDGLIMLYMHRQSEPIGLVENIRLRDKKLIGTLRFSPNHQRANEVWADVRDGFLRDISIGYSVQEWIEDAKQDLVRVTKWKLREVSVVTLPKDPTIGVNRAEDDAPPDGAIINRSEDNTMPNENKPSGDEPGTTQPPIATRADKLDHTRGVNDGVTQERTRVAEINTLFSAPQFRSGFEYLQTRAIDEGWDIERTRGELLSAIGNGATPAGGSGGASQAEGGGFEIRSDAQLDHGASDLEKFAEGAELWLSVRAGLEPDKDKAIAIRATEFGGMKYADIAREYLRRAGHDLRGFRDNTDMCGKAMMFRASPSVYQGSGSLQAITENIANKAMLMGFEEETQNWRMIARTGSTGDFRQFSRAGITSFESLEEVDENGEYKRGAFGDRAEKGQLVKGGKIWGVSMEALANDDLDALVSMPRMGGRAGQRFVADSVFNVVILNPTLNQDGVAVFDAAHNNIMADVGAPSVARLDEMDTAMGNQADTDASGNTIATNLNIELARVVVPRSFKHTANVLRTAEKDPAIPSGEAPNTFAGSFEVVADSRLSGTTWYGLADPDRYDVIEVVFLNGQQEPVLLTREGWSVDGIELKVTMPCVAIPLDFRTMTRNPGA